MAGSPMKRALAAELERRTRAAWPDEPERCHLDYVAEWQANGKFLKALARELGVSPAYLNEYLRLKYGAPVVRETLSRAREEAATLFAEEAVEIADEATEDNIGESRLQVSTRQWLTEKWNQRDYGKTAGVQVNVSIGQLMLAALQAPAPSAIASAIDEDAEVLSLTESTTSETD